MTRIRALDRGRGLAERLAEVREPGELGGQLLLFGFLTLGANPGQRFLELSECDQSPPTYPITCVVEL